MKPVAVTLLSHAQITTVRICAKVLANVAKKAQVELMISRVPALA
jgi:hypothetical protein